MKISEFLKYAAAPLMIQVIDAESGETFWLTSDDNLYKQALSAELIDVAVFQDDAPYLLVSATAIIYGDELFIPAKEEEE